MSLAMNQTSRFPLVDGHAADPAARSFGRRLISYASPPRADVDHALPDLRRLIDQNTQPLPMLLPVVVGGAVVVTMSGALWLYLWQIAHVVGGLLVDVM